MKNFLLVFCLIISILLSACNKKNENANAFAHRQQTLRNESDVNDYINKKKTIKKEEMIKQSSIREEWDAVSEWVNNVGEAIDMMK